MLNSDPQTFDSPTATRPPLAALTFVMGVLATVLAILSAAVMQSTLVPLGAFVIMAVIVARSFASDYPHRDLGLCNTVTLVRATLVAFLFGAVFDPRLSDWLIFAVATLAFALDGLDGWLARRSGLLSRFGARFDMETDAALAAVLALWLLASGITGPEILILGFTRYAFVLAAQVVPALRRDLPPSFRRKAVCVVQIATLIILIFPLTPPALIPSVSIAAPALLLWSFATDVHWLLRRSTSETRSRGQAPSGWTRILGHPGFQHALRLILASVVLHLLLIQPNHPAGITWNTLGRFPLELPVIVLALLAFGQSRAAFVLRAGIVAGLLGLTLLKTADFAMFTALTRPFNPVADLALVDAGFRLLSGAIGPVMALLAIFAALCALVALAWAAWWATGVWAKAAPRGVRWQGIAAGSACLASGLAVADVGHRMERWELPVDLPGAAYSARIAAAKLQTSQATLADLRSFEAAAATDPFAETPGLLDLIDRDVIIVFVESYGRTSLDTPLYADLHRETLLAGQDTLEDLGLATASGVLASPTRGGQSWLAHATFANGLWIDGQTRHGAVLASDRQTLFHIAARAGFHTAAVMPQITLDWPESSTMGFETVLAARDLGYEGLNFNWVTMPDQFTYAALDRLLRSGERDRPLFAQVATGSSHAPWVPVPTLVPWDAVGDGRIFDEMAMSGDTPKAVWKDRDRVRAQYRLAVDYALQAVLSYAAIHAGDPPLLIVMGDHQAASFVAQDERPDVPIHVIGPAHLVKLAASWGLSPGLVPPSDAPVVSMDRMRDLVLNAFSSSGTQRHAAR